MKSVFLVDDSATMLMSLKGTLQISGYKVETASDGEAALNKLKAGYRPDLIITDINMPKLDGIGLIREARKLLRFVPILALTTESQQGKRDEAIKLVPTQFADEISLVGSQQRIRDRLAAWEESPVTTIINTSPVFPPTSWLIMIK